MTLLVSHQGGGEASVRSTQSGWVRWAGHRAADHPVLPCSPAVLLVRGARPPAAAPTSEEPPERPPWETPHAASPQLHELHETHSVTQVSGHAPPGVGPGPAWVDAGQPPFRPPGLLGNAPQVGEMGWVPLNSREDSILFQVFIIWRHFSFFAKNKYGIKGSVQFGFLLLLFFNLVKIYKKESNLI